jgi:hypothetical protein
MRPIARLADSADRRCHERKAFMAVRYRYPVGSSIVLTRSRRSYTERNVSCARSSASNRFRVTRQSARKSLVFSRSTKAS